MTYTLTGNSPWTVSNPGTYNLAVSMTKGNKTHLATLIEITVAAYAKPTKVETNFLEGKVLETAKTTFEAKGDSKTYVKLSDNNFTGKNKPKVNGTEYDSGLKLDSAGSLTVVAKTKNSFTLYLGTNTTVKLGSTLSTPTHTFINDNDTFCYTFTFTLDAGEHTITKRSGENSIFYAVLDP